MLLTTATVVLSRVISERWIGSKMIDEKIENTTVFECGDLNEAAEWVQEHSGSLASGERYGCEEI